MLIDTDEFPSLLQLQQVGDHVYEGKPEHEGTDLVRNVVFGGQILAQMIVAAHLDRNTGRFELISAAVASTLQSCVAA